MDYIPNTDADRAAMLEVVGVESMADLFHDVPEQFRFPQLDLPPALTEMEMLQELQALADGTLQEGHARALLGLDTAQEQVAALQLVIKKGLSVRQTEELVRRLCAEPPEPEEPADETTTPESRSLEDQFRARLGTKVQLFRNRKGRGRLVIHFYSDDQLQGLYEQIVG